MPKMKTMLHSEIAARLNSIIIQRWRPCTHRLTATFSHFSLTTLHVLTALQLLFRNITWHLLINICYLLRHYVIFISLTFLLIGLQSGLFCFLFCLNILACRSTPMRQHWNNFFKACQAPFDIFFFFVLPPPLVFLSTTAALSVLCVRERCSRSCLSQRK